MSRLSRLILICLSFLSGVLRGQSAEERSVDLQGEWLISESNKFRKWDEEPARAIYFSIEAGQFRGARIEIRDHVPYTVLINQMLIESRENGVLRLPIDSLARIYNSPMSVAVFVPSGVHSLSTHVLLPASPVQEFDDALLPRLGRFFEDFSLTATLVLLLLFVFLVGNYSRGMTDYLNVFRLFSFQERDDNVPTRVTSRVNLLFYLFCSLFCSLILLTIFNHTHDVVTVANFFPIHSVGQGIFQWIKLTVMIGIILFLKLGIVYTSASLFKMREVAAVQFVQFIRSLFLFSTLMGLICIGNFVFRGTSDALYLVSLKIGVFVLIVSAAVMFLKLTGLVRHHFFHLFSYLCASEIIPLVIVLKILLD